MFLRFMQIKVNPDAQQFIRGFYERIVLPDLQQSPGCLYSSLLQNNMELEEFVFISLWDGLTAAEIYEDSAPFLKFQEDIRPFLATSTEWKLQLSENMELEYTPTKQEPVFKGFDITAKSGPPRDDIQKTPQRYLRLISLNLQPEKIEEFRSLYNSEIIPALRKTAGCLYAYLIEGVQANEEIISLTIWETKEDADAYEKSGEYSRLVHKVQHTFSKFFQWKMALEQQQSAHVQTTDDIKINTYGFVHAQKIA